jgi:hypothetical protein
MRITINDPIDNLLNRTNDTRLSILDKPYKLRISYLENEVKMMMELRPEVIL